MDAPAEIAKAISHFSERWHFLGAPTVAHLSKTRLNAVHFCVYPQVMFATPPMKHT